MMTSISSSWAFDDAIEIHVLTFSFVLQQACTIKSTFFLVNYSGRAYCCLFLFPSQRVWMTAFKRGGFFSLSTVLTTNGVLLGSVWSRSVAARVAIATTGT